VVQPLKDQAVNYYQITRIVRRSYVQIVLDRLC